MQFIIKIPRVPAYIVCEITILQFETIELLSDFMHEECNWYYKISGENDVSFK